MSSPLAAFSFALPLRAAKPAITGFQRQSPRILHACANSEARPTRPLFPAFSDVGDIPPIPPGELAAFKEKHVNSTKVKDSAEKKDRRARCLELQYARWEWACDNFETYVNMLRSCGHADEKISAMLAGTPMCFADPEAYRALRVALKALAGELENEMGWRDVAFVITGSSVPGFSQNPIKGFEYTPSKVTSVDSSDVDISVVAHGVEATMDLVDREGRGEPPKRFETTISATEYATRFGIKDLSVLSKCVDEFYKDWSQRLPGGLQLTFAERVNPIPPWEAHVDISDV